MLSNNKKKHIDHILFIRKNKIRIILAWIKFRVFLKKRKKKLFERLNYFPDEEECINLLSSHPLMKLFSESSHRRLIQNSKKMIYSNGQTIRIKGESPKTAGIYIFSKTSIIKYKYSPDVGFEKILNFENMKKKFHDKLNNAFISKGLFILGVEEFFANTKCPGYCMVASNDSSHIYVESIIIPYKSIVNEINNYYLNNSIEDKMLDKETKSKLVSKLLYLRTSNLYKIHPLTIEMLKTSWILEACNDPLLIKLQSKAEPICFATNECIIKKGTNDSYLYLLVDGSASLFKSSKDISSNPIESNTLTQGCFVGEMSIIQNSMRSFSLKSNNFSSFWRIHRKNLLEIFKFNDELQKLGYKKARIVRKLWLKENRYAFKECLLEKLLSSIFKDVPISLLNHFIETSDANVYFPGEIIASKSNLCNVMVLIVNGEAQYLRADLIHFPSFLPSSNSAIIGEYLLIHHRWPLTISCKKTIDCYELNRDTIIKLFNSFRRVNTIYRENFIFKGTDYDHDLYLKYQEDIQTNNINIRTLIKKIKENGWKLFRKLSILCDFNPRNYIIDTQPKLKQYMSNKLNQSIPVKESALSPDIKRNIMNVLQIQELPHLTDFLTIKHKCESLTSNVNISDRKLIVAERNNVNSEIELNFLNSLLLLESDINLGINKVNTNYGKTRKLSHMTACNPLYQLIRNEVIENNSKQKLEKQSVDNQAELLNEQLCSNDKSHKGSINFTANMDQAAFDLENRNSINSNTFKSSQTINNSILNNISKFDNFSNLPIDSFIKSFYSTNSMENSNNQSKMISGDNIKLASIIKMYKSINSTRSINAHNSDINPDNKIKKPMQYTPSHNINFKTSQCDTKANVPTITTELLNQSEVNENYNSDIQSNFYNKHPVKVRNIIPTHEESMELIRNIKKYAVQYQICMEFENL